MHTGKLSHTDVATCTVYNMHEIALLLYNKVKIPYLVCLGMLQDGDLENSFH